MYDVSLESSNASPQTFRRQRYDLCFADGNREAQMAVISPERRSKFEAAKNGRQALAPILPLAPSKAPVIIIVYPYHDYFSNT